MTPIQAANHVTRHRAEVSVWALVAGALACGLLGASAVVLALL